MNMTGEQIKKALDRCRENDPADCKKCPHFSYVENCVSNLFSDVLDYINLIEAENSKLQAEIERLKKEPYQFAIIEKMYSKVIAASINDFAERLRRTIIDTPFDVNCSGESEDYKDGCLHGLVAKQHNILDVLDNLLKEMVVSEE